MKICHLTSVHPANDVRIFIKECCSLAEEGHEVYLVVPNAVSEKKNNVTIIGVQHESTGRIKRIIDTTKKVYKQALLIDADIYHFHDPELIPIGIKLSRKGKKVIYDVHEDVPRDILSKNWIPKVLRKVISFTFEKYEKWAAKKFNYIVTATPFLSDRFKQYNNNTVDINNYPILKEIFINEGSWGNKTGICYIGGIHHTRGINEMLDALSLVNTSSEQVILNLAGPLDSSLHQELESKSNWKYVDYKGVLDRQSINEILNKSQIGMVTLHPLINFVDALPVKMFEYMAAGIPVIASDFPLWKKIVKNNNCGICVDPLNPSKIAEAISYLVNNPEMAQEMGKNGRNAVENIYSWEAEKKKLLNVYNVLKEEAL